MVTMSPMSVGVRCDARMIGHTSLHFKSQEAWDKALQGPEGALLLADVSNYSSETPIILVGEVIRKS
ncbi:hypothetical protein DSL72_005259 [Monilinia vaccinii-corymbosi]|uniref:Uncharacterized protein n=1 Tax=Monilinia vaccinii-corymbosi TaxID=61207 RepID=A0A8A3PEW0_9HELO|nr:hypothetical protein DSL72_005259 [Monilinia vaccinii-corymbosi]